MSRVTHASAPTLSRRFITFFHAVRFVLGFSLVFIVGWGGAATLLGQLFGQYKSTLVQVGGVLGIVFGLATLRALKIPWLYYDTRPQWSAKRRGGWLASGLTLAPARSAGVGMFFAAGWTPGVGTTLGAILTLGFRQQPPDTPWC